MNPEWIIPDWPAPPSVRALVTTRSGQDDDPQAAAIGRQHLRQEIPGLPADPLWLNQVHGIEVQAAENVRHGVKPVADACAAHTPGLVCAVRTADCLPLLLCDRDGTSVAAAHAGWRGLAAGVIEASVSAMQAEPARLLAWMGPAIGPAAFEVGDEVRSIFCQHDPRAAEAFAAHRPGKWLCNLYQLARQRLAALGVHQVSGGEWCTFSDPQRFYSYRRDGSTGHMASLIWLQE